MKQNNRAEIASKGQGILALDRSTSKFLETAASDAMMMTIAPNSLSHEKEGAQGEGKGEDKKKDWLNRNSDVRRGRERPLASLFGRGEKDSNEIALFLTPNLLLGTRSCEQNII